MAASIAAEAPRGVLKTYPARHFEVYQGAVFEKMVADQVVFLVEALHVERAAAATATAGSDEGTGRPHSS